MLRTDRPESYAGSRRRWWCCEACREVVPGLAHVEWASGLRPQSSRLCATCAAGLKRMESIVDAPIDSVIWDVRILTVQGDFSLTAAAA